jgi:hypothetical protein
MDELTGELKQQIVAPFKWQATSYDKKTRVLKLSMVFEDPDAISI